MGTRFDPNSLEVNTSGFGGGTPMPLASVIHCETPPGTVGEMVGGPLLSALRVLSCVAFWIGTMGTIRSSRNADVASFLGRLTFIGTAWFLGRVVSARRSKESAT